MTFREFIKRFPDEEQCRAYLFELRFSNGFVCPRCGHAEYWKIGEHL
ncbi:MAG: transposase [Treponema sp.]|nr:transposase [Treponema sp.]